MFTQEVDTFLQNGGLVHFSGVARQHGTKLLDEDIELVSSFLLRLITGLAAIQSTHENHEFCVMGFYMFTTF